MAERTVLLIGGTGNGKSTLGNVLAGEKVFKESDKAASETKHAQVHYVTIEGTRFKIVDTIGIGDTELSPEAVCMRIADACVECKDGINQVLFVTKNRFTKAEMGVYNMMRDVLLGPEVDKFTTVVRTYSPQFRDAAWCTSCFELCGEETKAILRRVPAVLFISCPNEHETSDWVNIRAESRQRVLMRLQACGQSFQPPSLRQITASVGKMVEEHKEQEEAIKRNKELLEENKRMQKEAKGNKELLATLVAGQKQLQEAMAAAQQQAHQLEMDVKQQSRGDGSNIFDKILAVLPVILPHVVKGCCIS